MEKAVHWREVAPAHQRAIFKRLADLADGYHFAGLLGMEAYVKLAIKELKRAADEPESHPTFVPEAPVSGTSKAIAMLEEGLKRHERQEWSWQFGRLEECAKQALAVLVAAAEPEAKAVSGSEPGGFLPCKCDTAGHCAVHYDENGDPR